jgi:hypothetical protein
MRATSLALSKQQYEIIGAHSRSLSAYTRSRYLLNVSDQLMGLHSITDADVEAACNRVLRRMGVAA